MGVDDCYIRPWLRGKACNGRLLQLTDPLDRPTHLGPDPPTHHGSVPLDRPTHLRYQSEAQNAFCSSRRPPSRPRGVGHSPSSTPITPGAAGPRGWGLTTQPRAPGGDGEVPPQVPPPPPRGFRSTHISPELLSAIPNPTRAVRLDVQPSPRRAPQTGNISQHRALRVWNRAE